MSCLGYTHRHWAIPAYMVEGLDAYIERGRPVGDFLYALLSNNLVDAICRADETNIENLPAYVMYLLNEAPSACYGSRAKVDAWLELHRPRPPAPGNAIVSLS